MNLSSPLVDEISDEARPSRLMTGAAAGAVLAVKVLVKQQMVAPVRIALEFLRRAVDPTAAVRRAREESDQPIGNLLRHVARRERMVRPGGRDGELRLQSRVEFHERL